MTLPRNLNLEQWRSEIISDRDTRRAMMSAFVRRVRDKSTLRTLRGIRGVFFFLNSQQ